MTRKLRIAAILSAAGLLGAILLVAAWQGRRDEPPREAGDATPAPGSAGPSAASPAEPASGDVTEDERQYSLDQPIDLPVTPDGRSPLDPRDLKLPAPNPNAPDSASEGTPL